MRDMGNNILRPGQEIHLSFSAPGIIRGRSKKSPAQLKAIEIDYPGANLTWERGIHGILFQNGENPYDIELKTASVVVESSLLDDGRKAGINPALLTQLANIFHTEVDFEKDVQRGDSFKILYEQRSRRGQPAQNSLRVMAAELINAGKKLTAVYFEKKKGTGSYYNLEGRSMARAFLRFPVDFTTITSQFAASRFNPVLRSSMPHTGVDFAAERGTPVRAVGDGVITQAGWNGGYGKTIDLQHDATFMTRYAHLDSFAEGIQNGSSVRKGDVIGFVGSTGRSTGPHLHFELYKDNQYIDPMSVEFPVEDNIEPAQQRTFEIEAHNLLAELTALPEL